MIVRKLRLERGWSQEQLAQLTGLNIRTIQRIERGHNAGLESLNALAAVFEVELSELNSQEKPAMNDTTLTENQTQELSQATASAYNARHAQTKILIVGARFALIICLLFGINFATSPNHIWAWWPAMGMGIAFAFKCVDKLIIDRLKSHIETKP